MGEKRLTEYKVGDTLYERKVVRDEDYNMHRVVREWTVLSVVADALYTDEEGPMQVVTLRAFTQTRVVYKAEIAARIDISVEEGFCRHTREEAEAGWLKEDSRLRREDGVLMLDLGLVEKVPAEVFDHRGEERAAQEGNPIDDLKRAAGKI